MFQPIPQIRKKHLIQFILREDRAVITRIREGCTGSWINHGDMLKRGWAWPDSIEEDLISVPPPSLKPSRVEHIRSNILPIIIEEKREFWDHKAPPDVAAEYILRNRSKLRTSARGK